MKTALKGKIIAINASIRKKEAQIKNVMRNPKILEKQQKI